MYTDIGKLLEDIRALQNQLEDILDGARERFRYTMEGGRAHFTREVQQLQRRYRVSTFRYILASDWRSIVTAPLIYAMFVPLAVIDLSFTLYQHICFRAYGVPRVRRRNYMVNDRHNLAYLNVIEKINCTYCGYGNGVIAYAREVISRTEQYWCPIRHANRVADPHARYLRFFAFGDAQGFQKGYQDKRQALREEPHDQP